VGSYASPGWFIAGRRMIREGKFGPDDVAEMFDDATRIVVADQLEAGVDILTDGELRRQRFVFEMFDRIEGLDRETPGRRLGIPGIDMAPGFVANGPLTSPQGFGVIEDFMALKDLVPDRPLKIAIPGPLTFGNSIIPQPGTSEPPIEEIIGLLRTELEGLVAAGADYIQLDEPGLTDTPYGLGPEDAADVINQVLRGLPVKLAVHVCFGNNAGRPAMERSMDRLMPAIERLECHQLVLEFANRQMADLELLKPLSGNFDIAAGLIDVKNFYLETPEEVAARIRQCLELVPAKKLTITSDCGFSALPRYMARKKMQAMVAGARLVRAEL
jgi:5-methyltetrahydropteroyltriglutamate--homocysteine methyltransferase